MPGKTTKTIAWTLKKDGYSFLIVPLGAKNWGFIYKVDESDKDPEFAYEDQFVIEFGYQTKRDVIEKVENVIEQEEQQAWAQKHARPVNPYDPSSALLGLATA